MMIEPPVEKLSEKAGNKYRLCVLASKRAEEIQKENYENGVNPEIKEISQACNEIINDELVLEDDDK